MNNVEAGNIRSGSEKLKATYNIKGFDEVCDSEEEEKRKTNNCSNMGFNGKMVPSNVKVDSKSVNDENVEVTSNVRVCDKVCNDEEKIMNKTNFGGNIGGGEENVINNVNLSGNKNDDKETESSYNEIFSLKEELIKELSILKNSPIADRETLMKINQTNKFRKLFIIGNEALKQICEVLNPDLTELNQLIYCTSKILQHKCGIKFKMRKNSTTKKPSKPRWQMKIENEIGNLRKEISILDELQNGKLKTKKNYQKVPPKGRTSNLYYQRRVKTKITM